MNTYSKSWGKGLGYCLVLLLLLMGLLVGGCGSSSEQKQKAQSQGYTVTDARGKAISFTEKPQRIVSLYVFADEVLLDLVDHKRIAGLDKWVFDPGLSLGYEDAKDVTKVVDQNIEGIIAVKPDLVLLPDSSKADFIESLEDVGQRVFVYKLATRADEIPGMITSLGQAVGEPERAATMNRTLAERLAAVQKKVEQLPADARERALLLLRFGAIGGKGCIFNDIMTLAGVEDCYNDVRPADQLQPGLSRILSKEEAVKANPDTIILGAWSQGGAYADSDRQLEEMYNDPAFADVGAIKNKRVVVIPQSYVNCLSQHIATGVERLHEAVYEK